MANQTTLNSVEEVIDDFRAGKVVIVVDDEDRENEGDFIVAAEKITPEIVNFMLKEGRGVLCAPLSEERCEQLGLNMMEENNTSLLGTPFTVTVDLLGGGCTTGVSIHDRAAADKGIANIFQCVRLADFYGITLDELVGREPAQSSNSKTNS